MLLHGRVRGHLWFENWSSKSSNWGLQWKKKTHWRYIPAVFIPSNSIDTNHSNNYPPQDFQSRTRYRITLGKVSGDTISVLKQETDFRKQVQVVCCPTPSVTHEKPFFPLLLLHLYGGRKLCWRPSHHTQMNSVCESECDLKSACGADPGAEGSCSDGRVAELVTVNHLSSHVAVCKYAVNQSINPVQPSILLFRWTLLFVQPA